MAERDTAVAVQAAVGCCSAAAGLLRMVNWTTLGVVLELDRRVLSGFSPPCVYLNAAMGVLRLEDY